MVFSESSRTPMNSRFILVVHSQMKKEKEGKKGKKKKKKKKKEKKGVTTFDQGKDKVSGFTEHSRKFPTMLNVAHVVVVVVGKGTWTRATSRLDHDVVIYMVRRY